MEYVAALPGGDLADRFGFSSMIGGSAGLKLKSNFYFRVGMSALFGGTVKERIAENVLIINGNDTTGFVGSGIGADGRFNDVYFFERGYMIPVTAGKIFPIAGVTNPNSGIYVELSGQFMQHKVRLEVPSSNVPAVDPELRYGYDRLTNGLGVTQSFGYIHHSQNRFLNFYVGGWFSQNFTASRRDVQFDIGVPDQSSRLDLLWGIRAGWSFLIYRGATEKEYYY